MDNIRLYNRITFLLMICIASLCSCDMIDYHPYDVRIDGEKDINNKNITRIEAACKDKTTLRFVTMGDTQRWYDETEEFVNAINARDDIDFVIHGGDISDFGATNEFEWQRNIMNKLNVPYVVIIGNHDCLGTGQETYKSIFGDTNFSFIVGRVKFLCLNTNSMEFDYTEAIPNFDYIESEATERADEFDRTVVCMHVRPYCMEFNNNVVKPFQYYLNSLPGLMFCTAAHEHSQYEEDVFGDGIMYYISACIKKRSFYIFTITPDGYEREVVYF